MNISYDYEELINELKSDVKEGLISLSDALKIVREKDKIKGYSPIIDYYYISDPCNEEYTVSKVKDVLEEMEHYNEIIISRSLKSLRIQKGLTQEKLAQLMGVMQHHISRWETNERVPDLKNIIKLALNLDVTADEIIKAITEQSQE